jgi:hypothetical protein
VELQVESLHPQSWRGRIRRKKKTLAEKSSALRFVEKYGSNTARMGAISFSMPSGLFRFSPPPPHTHTHKLSDKTDLYCSLRIESTANLSAKITTATTASSLSQHSSDLVIFQTSSIDFTSFDEERVF